MFTPKNRDLEGASLLPIVPITPAFLLKYKLNAILQPYILHSIYNTDCVEQLINVNYLINTSVADALFHIYDSNLLVLITLISMNVIKNIYIWYRESGKDGVILLLQEAHVKRKPNNNAIHSCTRIALQRTTTQYTS